MKYFTTQEQEDNAEVSQRDNRSQDINNLIRRAIAEAQPLAVHSDNVIVFDSKPLKAKAFVDVNKFLHAMSILFADIIQKGPKGSAIFVSVLLRGLQVMVALEGKGEGLSKTTIDSVLPDFDRVMWPKSTDPTDVTILYDRFDIDRTILHVRKLAAVEEIDNPELVLGGNPETLAVLVFPRISLR